MAKYHGPLSAEQLRRIRALIPCVVCRQVPGDDGWIKHTDECRVPYNREGNRGRGRPRKNPPKVWDRKCKICNGPVPEPPADLTGKRGAMRAKRICSEKCHRERRARTRRAQRALKKVSS